MFYNPHETNFDIDFKTNEDGSPSIYPIDYIHSLQHLRKMTLDKNKIDEFNSIIQNSIDSYFEDGTEVALFH